jgi:hypothetical protein
MALSSTKKLHKSEDLLIKEWPLPTLLFLNKFGGSRRIHQNSRRDPQISLSGNDAILPFSPEFENPFVP